MQSVTELSRDKKNEDRGDIVSAVVLHSRSSLRLFAQKVSIHSVTYWCYWLLNVTQNEW